MNPWDVLGWILVVLLALVCLAVLIVIIFFSISYGLFLRDESRKKSMTFQPPTPKLHEWPDAINSGDSVKVGPQEFLVTEVESDYDIDYDRYRFRVTLQGERGSASKIKLLDT